MPNFKLTQDWVGYLDRSYEQVKASVLRKLMINNPEVTDHSESNILIIIISMFAGMIEMLNLYIDRMAQESFLGTARRYASALKLVRLLDYRPKTRRAAYVDITYTIYNTSTNQPAALSIPLLIPSGVEIDAVNGTPFFNQDSLTIPAGFISGISTAIQAVTNTNVNLGVTSGLPNQLLLIGDDYVQGSLNLLIAGEAWTLVDTLGLSMPADKNFIIEVSEDKQAYIQFGDGTNGAIPGSGFVVYGTFQTTDGETGNLPPNTITNLVTDITLPAGFELRLSHADYSMGGQPFEGLEELRNYAPRDLRSLKRAVTPTDFKDLAELHPGVSSASVRYCCGECVRIYISPKTRGIATQLLLKDVRNYFNCKRLLGRCVTVLPAGITRIYLKAEVVAKYMALPADVLNDVGLALNDEYGYDSSQVNREINLSDLVALIDGLPKVDHLTIKEIWAEPYARPINTSTALNWSVSVGVNSAQKKEYRLIYDDVDQNFLVLGDGLILGYAELSVPYILPNNSGSFTIQPGLYIGGNEWDFTVYPYGTDIVVDDNTIPIIDVDVTVIPIAGFYNITVIPTTIQNQCNTNC